MKNITKLIWLVVLVASITFVIDRDVKSYVVTKREQARIENEEFHKHIAQVEQENYSKNFAKLLSETNK